MELPEETASPKNCIVELSWKTCVSFAYETEVEQVAPMTLSPPPSAWRRLLCIRGFLLVMGQRWKSRAPKKPKEKLHKTSLHKKTSRMARIGLIGLVVEKKCFVRSQNSDMRAIEKVYLRSSTFERVALEQSNPNFIRTTLLVNHSTARRSHISCLICRQGSSLIRL